MGLCCAYFSATSLLCLHLQDVQNQYSYTQNRCQSFQLHGHYLFRSWVEAIQHLQRKTFKVNLLGCIVSWVCIFYSSLSLMIFTNNANSRTSIICAIVLGLTSARILLKSLFSTSNDPNFSSSTKHCSNVWVNCTLLQGHYLHHPFLFPPSYARANPFFFFFFFSSSTKHCHHLIQLFAYNLKFLLLPILQDLFLLGHLPLISGFKTFKWKSLFC